MSDKREQFRQRGREVIQEAWEINGAPGVSDEIETQLRILNGLLAMALTEVTAPPYDNGVIHLRDVFKAEREDF